MLVTKLIARSKVAWGGSQAADDFITSFGSSDCPAASQLAWASSGHWKPALTHARGQDRFARTGEQLLLSALPSNEQVILETRGRKLCLSSGEKVISVPPGCPLPCHQPWLWWVPNVFKVRCCHTWGLTCSHPLPGPCSGGCFCSLLPLCTALLCKPWMLHPLSPCCPACPYWCALQNTLLWRWAQGR